MANPVDQEEAASRLALTPIDRALLELSCEKHICDQFCGTPERRRDRREILRELVETVEEERDMVRERLALLDQAAEWAEDSEFGPIRPFEQKLKGDPIMSALYGLSDMRRIVWEPVSDLLHVSNFEEVVPALRAMETELSAAREALEVWRHFAQWIDQAWPMPSDRALSHIRTRAAELLASSAALGSPQEPKP